MNKQMNTCLGDIGLSGQSTLLNWSALTFLNVGLHQAIKDADGH